MAKVVHFVCQTRVLGRDDRRDIWQHPRRGQRVQVAGFGLDRVLSVRQFDGPRVPLDTAARRMDQLRQRQKRKDALYHVAARA